MRQNGIRYEEADILYICVISVNVQNQVFNKTEQKLDWGISAFERSVSNTSNRDMTILEMKQGMGTYATENSFASYTWGCYIMV